jgi:hypothetical protein
MVSAQSLNDFANTSSVSTFRSKKQRSIFEQLAIEPIDSRIRIEKNVSTHVNFVDSLGLMIVTKMYNDKALELPVVMHKTAYEEAVHRLYTRDAVAVSARKKVEIDQLNGGREHFKFGTDVKSKALESIFGSSEVSISINGNINVEISGSSKTQEGVASSLQEQEQGRFSPKLDLKQKFFLEGKIGDKLTITAHQDSEADFDLENVIQIKYKGYEDEIVQSVEAGNISLTLPGSSLINNTESHQGLFGLKTHLKFGDLNFTGVASVINGEKKKQSYNPHRTDATTSDGVSSETLKDHEFVKYQFFFVDTVFRNRFEQYNDITDFPLKDINTEHAGVISDIDVYVSTDNNDDVTLKRYATAIVSGDVLSEVDSTNSKEGIYETLGFKKLRETEYGYNPELGYFYLKRRFDNRTIAISYRVQDYENLSNNPNNNFWISEDDFNTYDSQDAYLLFRENSSKTNKYLKLIKSKNQSVSNNTISTYAQLEKLHMQNVYRLGFQANENLKVKIYTDSETKIGPELPDKYRELNYLSIFGLDRLNTAGDEVVGGHHRGDGAIDVNNTLLFEDVVNPRYLIFPFLRPFEPSEEAQAAMGLIKLKSGESFAWDQSFQSDNIYRYTNPVSQEKYTIKIEGDAAATSSVSDAESNTFKLNDFNIIEGSERVVINNERMIRGQDYDINYFTGEIILKSSRAILNRNSLEVEYEAPNLFQLDKKTLLGGQFDYSFDRGKIGLIALYLNKSSLDEKVRLGNEPFENFSWGLSGIYEMKSELLTEAANLIPGVQTSADSKVSIDAQFAQLIPNPNTRNNEDTGDNNGVAYLDDFEAAKRSSGLSLNRKTWVPASIPRIVNGQSFVTNLHLDSSRAQLTFFNPYVPYRSTFILDKNVSRNVVDEITILNMAIRKKTIIYDENKNVIPLANQPNKKPYVPPTPSQNTWAGIMTSNRHNRDLTNTRFLEIWVRWDYPTRTGVLPKLNIDFGSISEDYYTKQQVQDQLASVISSRPNGDYTTKVLEGYDLLSTEDILGGISDNILDPVEDVGLDRMTDEEEVAIYGVSNPLDNWVGLHSEARPHYFAGVDQSIFDSNHDLKSSYKSILPWRINETEGNSQESSYNLYPDNEDIDRDGTFDTFDQYFHVEIPMYTSDGDIQSHPYFSAFGKEKNVGWVQFRVPIRKLLEDKNYYPQSSQPSLTNADFIRVYVDEIDGLEEEDVMLVNIATLDFVGTDWLTIPPKANDDIRVDNIDIGTESDEIGIRFLNSDENQHTLSPVDNYASYYVAPRGVQADYIDSERTTRGREQTMVIDINNLKAGERVEVRKSGAYIAQKFSLHNYKKMKMFMRTHLLDINQNSTTYKLPLTRDEFRLSGANRGYFYLKFGTNSENFYEYRVPIIPSQLPAGVVQPNSNSAAVQDAYWADTSIEIDLDLLTSTKLLGTAEQFGGKYTGYYLYENPQDTLMERYRVVGAPDITNLQFMIFGVTNTNDLTNNTNPITTQIWVNELRVSDVRKETSTAMKMSLSANLSDVFRVSGNFQNSDANYHSISSTSSSNQFSTESQSYNMQFSVDKMLPSYWKLNLPITFNTNTVYQIPKFIPGSDAPTFYDSGDLFQKLGHLFGFASYSDDIKSLYNYTNTDALSFGFSKTKTNERWYNNFLFDRFTYRANFNNSLSSSSVYQKQTQESESHTFSYRYVFANTNYVEPFSWLGTGEWIDKLSTIRLYYSPNTVSTNLVLSQSESTQQKRGFTIDEPVINANSTRDFSVDYRLTEEIGTNLKRSYKSDISTVAVGDRKMTIYDAMENIVSNPFQKNAVGNDRVINNDFSIDFKPNLFQGLASTFNYSSLYTYTEVPSKDYSTQSNSKGYRYNLSYSPASLFRSLFKGQSGPSSPTGRTRGRGGAVPKSDFTSFFNPSPQDPPKEKRGLDINVLNPLVWGKDFLTSWDKINLSYTEKYGKSYDVLEQSTASAPFQFGFSDNIGVNSLDSLKKYGEINSTEFRLTNDFRFGTVSINLDYLTKETETLKEYGNLEYSKEYTFFSLNDDFQSYQGFRKSDTLGQDLPLGVFVPNWKITINGVEKWPIIKWIASSATLTHDRRGKVSTSYLSNFITKNPIERYAFKVSNAYSPLIGVNIQTAFNVNMSFSYNMNEELDLSSPTSGYKRTGDDLTIEFGYRAAGGFRFPFSFWPFNNAYVENNIDFSIKFKQSNSTPETYKRDADGYESFTKGAFSKTFSIEPVVQYKFSDTISGRVFYRYLNTENARIRAQTVNEFGLSLNLEIRN